MTKSVICRCALFILVSVAFARADQVALKNGDRVSGAIESMDGTTLVIQSTYFGKISVPWDQVETVNTEQQLHVVSGGETFQGNLTVAAGNAEVAGRSVPVTTVAAIRNESEQRAFERRIAPGWADLWTGELNLGFAGAVGNAQTLTFTTSAKAERPTNADNTSFFFNAIKASALIDGITSGTAQSIRAGWSYDRNVSPRLFIDFFNQYEYDFFADLDLRFLVGTGLGYKLWRRNTDRFNLVGGLAYTREYFSTPLTQNAAEAYWGDDFDFRISTITSLSQTYRMYNSLTEGGDYRINGDLGLQNKLSRWLSWNVDLSNRYNNHPVAGKKTNDFIYSTSLGVTFGSNE